MKIAVTGARGQIGRRLVALGAVALDCNILDRGAIENELHRVNPDVIIHAAGISSIDECQKDYARAVAVNVWGFNNLCELAGDGKVVLLSSEQVFDGKKGQYAEDDEPNPINNYGLTKLAAEGVAKLYDDKIIRLSRGISNRIGSDIYNYIQRLRAGEKIYVPCFISRNYCHLDLLAKGIWEYANRYDQMPPVLHYGGKRSLLFHELMVMIADLLIGTRDGIRIRRHNPDAERAFAPRPFMCGFDVSLAQSLSLPLFAPEESVGMLIKEQPHEN